LRTFGTLSNLENIDMKQITIYIAILATATILLFSGCKTPSSNSCDSDFDQLALLTNIGTNIIAPSYQTFATEAATLNSDALAFTANPTTSNLTTLRNQLQQIWLTWQTAGIFEFGPAATEELRSYMDNFPAFTVRMDTAIVTGTYDLTTETYSYTRGFPALDYLLYGIGATASDIVNQYTTDANATNRKQYLKDVTALILLKANTVNDAWKATGGNYLGTFVGTEGVANGKPLSDLVNQLNQGYEQFKNNKLMMPISAITSYIPLLPQNVEAYYSRTSLDLAIEAVTAVKNVFLGYTNGADNIGLDDYLIAVEAKKNNANLHTLIIDQYDLAISTLNDLKPSSLHDAINNNLNGVKAAYAAAQNQMVMTKTNMPSALCISITYIDNVDDGD